jgi:hypothetical protein
MQLESWIEDVRAQGVRRVATALGLQIDSAPRRGLRPCPSCGAEHRGSRDKRAPAELTNDEGGWHCYRCEAKGNAVSLASWVLLKTASPAREQWAFLRRSLGFHGLCALEDGKAPRKTPPAQPASPPPQQRPPQHEVLALWHACRPVTADADLAAYLAGQRHLRPAAIEDFNLARALPVSGWLPGWARCRGRTWRDTQHRLVVPLFGPSGSIESLHARTLVPSQDYPKGLSPAGVSVGGLVMANALAQLMLAGTPLSDGSAASLLIGQTGLVITEGVPDFLTWSSHFSDANENAPAVLGIISGSFTSEIAARIPDGCRIAVRRHGDAAGEKYAAAIVEELAPRCRVYVSGPLEHG